MASGIVVEDECKDKYDQLKLKHMHSYIIFKISKDLKKIEVDEVGEKGKSYSDFCDALTVDKNEGRYAVYDCNYAKGKSKIVFITWCDDNNVPIKLKMLYSSSKKALLDKLLPPVELQCNDRDDFEWDNLVSKCASKYD